MHVLIVDDHLLFSEAIRAVLEDAGFGPVDVVSTGAEAIEGVEDRPPNVALIDVVLASEDGVEIGKRILSNSPDVKVVLITALREPEVLREARDLGFHGYIPKDTPAQQFVAAVASVADGHPAFPQTLADPWTNRRSPEERDALFLASQLTERERDVLTLLAQGLSGKQVARRLHITDLTVRKHVGNIMAKMNVHTRLEAVALAFQHRLVPADRPVTVV